PHPTFPSHGGEADGAADVADAVDTAGVRCVDLAEIDLVTAEFFLQDAGGGCLARPAVAAQQQDVRDRLPVEEALQDADGSVLPLQLIERRRPEATVEL